MNVDVFGMSWPDHQLIASIIQSTLAAGFEGVRIAGLVGGGMTESQTEKNQVAKWLYLDDLQVGQRFTSGTYAMDEERIKEFAAEFDPQPFHLDEDAARKSVFHGLAASGWHTAAATMRLLVTGGLPLAGGLIGLGGEVTWPRPTRPGDVLRVESEIVQIIPSRSKPNQGVVIARSVTLNQRGEEVQVLMPKLLVFKREVNPQTQS